MGIYLNPGSSKFQMSRNAQIYVDKSELISKLNPLVETEDRYVCVSRPRRFGKTMAANMLAAYYGNGEETKTLFDDLKIAKDTSYDKHLNKHLVLQLNMQNFLSENDSIEEMLEDLQQEVIMELESVFPDMVGKTKSLPRVLEKIYAKTKQTFIILIDEWDCLFREYKNNVEAQKIYLDFLRNWLKDRGYVGLAYMTGILPIKKYGSHSALNMFNEFSMVNSGDLTEYFGFTEREVESLCKQYHMNFEETKLWYDGYSLNLKKLCESEKNEISIYSPKSVVEAMKRHTFDTYWNQTETYEALQIYIQMNFDNLKDAIVAMLAGENVNVNINKFANDMTSFNSKDDVLTLLIHLGYLTYNEQTGKVRVPNKEVSKEYLNAIEDVPGWNLIADAIKESKELMHALWNQDAENVAKGIEKAHQEVSILQYNDENALSYTIGLAFYYAREYYTIFRELPTGKGFADICFIPRKKYMQKPAILMELKWDRNTKSALEQIKEKQYSSALQEYKGNLLLVGINYDKKTKKHECIIEQIEKA